MLSHHEFATLILVKNNSSSAAELDNSDVDALLARQLITLERVGPDRCRPQITLQGYTFLKALGHART